MSERQPYVAPTLTRVVLQPTQAVLSQCSTLAVGRSTGTPGECTPAIHSASTVIPGCEKKGITGDGDQLNAS